MRPFRAFLVKKGHKRKKCLEEMLKSTLLAAEDAEDQLVAAVQDWLEGSQDIDFGQGISISQRTLSRNAAFVSLPQPLLESLGLLRQSGPMFKLAPRVMKRLRGETESIGPHSFEPASPAKERSAFTSEISSAKRARRTTIHKEGTMPMIVGYSEVLQVPLLNNWAIEQVQAAQITRASAY